MDLLLSLRRRCNEKVKLNTAKIKEDLITVQKKEPFDVRGKDHYEEMKSFSYVDKKQEQLKILNSNQKVRGKKIQKISIYQLMIILPYII